LFVLSEQGLEKSVAGTVWIELTYLDHLHPPMRNTPLYIAMTGIGRSMTEPLVRLLDSVRIDDNREHIEFRFRGPDAEEQAIQIDFEYVESLAALFQQAFVSAVMAARQGANRSHRREYLSVPRFDIDYPISVAVDLMTERVVTMFMLGTPFQACYSMPLEIARTLAGDLANACDQVSRQRGETDRLTN
jgi:hypothetical protein